MNNEQKVDQDNEASLSKHCQEFNAKLDAIREDSVRQCEYTHSRANKTFAASILFLGMGLFVSVLSDIALICMASFSLLVGTIILLLPNRWLKKY